MPDPKKKAVKKELFGTNSKDPRFNDVVVGADGSASAKPFQKKRTTTTDKMGKTTTQVSNLEGNKQYYKGPDQVKNRSVARDFVSDSTSQQKRGQQQASQYNLEKAAGTIMNKKGSMPKK